MTLLRAIFAAAVLVAPLRAAAVDTADLETLDADELSRSITQDLLTGGGGCPLMGCSSFTLLLLGGAIGTLIWRSRRRELEAVTEVAAELGGHLLGSRRASAGKPPERATRPTTPRKSLPRPTLDQTQSWNEGVLERAGKNDPTFSTSGFLDFALLLHRQATMAAVAGSMDALRPFLVPMAKQALLTAHQEIVAIPLLAVDRLAVDGVDVEEHWTKVRLRLRSIRHEQTAGGEQLAFVEERWVLRRAAQAESLLPEQMLDMGCPACFAPVQLNPAGECAACGQPVCWGQFQWQADEVTVFPRRNVPVPKVEFAIDGPPDPGTHTAAEPLGDFASRHPEFDLDGFAAYVGTVYTLTRTLATEANWPGIRPYVLDLVLNQLLFKAARFSEHGLWHHLRDVQVTKMNIARIDYDAIYEHLTVWIAGTRLDYVINDQGATVGGDANRARPFAERWTFRRRQGDDMRAGPAGVCPACGHDLSAVDETGTCTACGTWVISGIHAWVVSRIDDGQES